MTTGLYDFCNEGQQCDQRIRIKYGSGTQRIRLIVFKFSSIYDHFDEREIMSFLLYSGGGGL